MDEKLSDFIWRLLALQVKKECGLSDKERAKLVDLLTFLDEKQIFSAEDLRKLCE